MKTVPTGSHWGLYEIGVSKGQIASVRPSALDPDPSPMHRSLPDIVDHPSRVRFPGVRQSYLRHGIAANRAMRGAEPFVRVSWDEAIGLVAAELQRVKNEHGNQAIFAGSYGWAS